MAEHVNTAVFIGVNTIHKGFRSLELPLHVPLLPIFSIEKDRTKDLSEEISTRVSGFNIFRITGLDRELLEDARKVGGSTLYSLHDELHAVVKDFDLKIDKAQAGKDYAPLAVDTSSQKLAENQVVQVREIYVAQQETDQNWRLLNADSGRHVRYLLKEPDQAALSVGTTGMNT